MGNFLIITKLKKVIICTCVNGFHYNYKKKTYNYCGVEIYAKRRSVEHLQLYFLLEIYVIVGDLCHAQLFRCR